jgi:hypothetical protein
VALYFICVFAPFVYAMIVVLFSTKNTTKIFHKKWTARFVSIWFWLVVDASRHDSGYAMNVSTEYATKMFQKVDGSPESV